MPLTTPSDLTTKRRLGLMPKLKTITQNYSPEEVLHVLADLYTMRATIGAEVEVAQWILKLAERIDARGD